MAVGARLRAWALALAIVAGPFALAGGAHASSANVPTLQGAFIIGNGTALAIVGYVGFANTWTQAGNGTQVYAGALDVVFFNLRPFPTVVTVVVRQDSGYNATTHVPVGAVSEQDQTIALPEDTHWRSTTIYFDGEAGWNGNVATPVSLLPNYILNVGGLDLFALTLVSFMLITSVGGYSLGRWAMTRAIYAPKFSLLIWGHVVIVAIAAAVFLDYQAVDAVFAGWSPLAYPWLAFPLTFLTALSTYNRGHRVLVTQGIATPSGELGHRLTFARIGRNADGKLAWVGESWGQFWARFWGHMPLVDDGDDASPKPFLAPVEMGASPTETPRARAKARQRAAVAVPSTSEALTRFPVVNPTSDIAYVAYGRSSEPIAFEFPRLVSHRLVRVAARVANLPAAGGPPVPTIVEPEHYERRLTWPHYEIPSGKSRVELEDRHYQPAAAVWAGFASIRDLGRALSKYGAQVQALTAALENRVQDEVYTKLRTHYALVGRSSSGITELEAQELTGKLPSLLSPKDRARSP